MNVGTRVLENGVWTHRIVGLHAILQHRQDQIEEDPSMMELPNVPSELGVMTSTLVNSPAANFILPIRIRDKDENDVVFVNRSSITIKELGSDGHLQEIATKSDFGSRILHAAVIGNLEWRDVAKNNGEIKRENADGDLMMSDNSEDSKKECPDSFQNYHPPSARLPAPQTLALTLASREMIFLQATRTLDGQIHLVCFRKPLPSVGANNYPVGKRIAVDPSSRAMAVAAEADNVVLYALRPRIGLSEGTSSPFIRQERLLSIKGRILQMEFLHPPKEDKTYVLLLLIVAGIDNVTRAVVWDWDCAFSLVTAKQRHTNGLRLPENRTNPLMLITLPKYTAFILVYENDFAVYTGILTGTLEQSTLEQAHLEPLHSAESLQSTDRPLFTSWARPVRTRRHSSRHDAIYLCREDGLVCYLEFEDNDSWYSRPLVINAGQLDGRIGTAFASLDLGENAKDMLVYGGEMSGGGLFMVHGERKPEQVERIPNWTPMTDFIAAGAPYPNSVQEPRDDRTAGSPQIAVEDRLFACNGQGQYGAITEMRAGYEARVGTSIPYHAGATRIWSLPDCAGSGTFLLVSFDLYNELLFLSADVQSMEQEDEKLHDSLDFHVRTIIAGGFDDTTIQITEKSVRLLSLSSDGSHNIPAPLVRILPNEETITSAAIHTATHSFVLVTRSDHIIRLFFTKVMQEQGGGLAMATLGESVLWDEQGMEPSCLTMCSIQGSLHIFVGTTDRNLRIYCADNGLVLIMRFQLDLVTLMERTTAAGCESLVVVRLPERAGFSRASNQLLCGMRDGYMLAYDIAVSGQGFIDPSSMQAFLIGQTPVSIRSDSAHPGNAFISCGGRLSLFTIHNGMVEKSSIREIWLNDYKAKSFSQEDIRDLTRIHMQSHSTNAGLASVVVCLAEDQLFLVELENSSKMIPRHWHLDGTPRKMIYSPRLNLLIIGLTKEVLDSSSTPVECGHESRKAVKISSLQFIDPDDGPLLTELSTVDSTASEAPVRKMLGKPNEIVLDLLDWTCTDGIKAHHFVVVATGLPPNSQTNHRGELILLSVGRTLSRRLEAKCRYSIFHERPVYSVAAYGQSSLISCSGTEMTMRKLNIAERKFDHLVTWNLSSPCLWISVQEPYVHLTTTNDSLQVWKYDQHPHAVEHIAGNAVSGTGQTHLYVPSLKLILSTDKEGGLIGTGMPQHGRVRCANESSFEALMPNILTRLRIARLRKSWQPRLFIPGFVPFSDDDANIEIIGASLYGTLHEIKIFREPAWRLLRWVQNLCLRSVTICPVVTATSLQQPLEPNARMPRGKHINGDVLVVLVEQGEDSLRELLDADTEQFPNLRRMPADFTSPSARRERLAELLKELLFPELTTGLVQCRFDIIDTTFDYLRKALNPPI